ncbi:MAG: hypothetical protein ACRCZP_09865 [Phycicoccus sp.]
MIGFGWIRRRPARDTEQQSTTTGTTPRAMLPVETETDLRILRALNTSVEGYASWLIARSRWGMSAEEAEGMERDAVMPVHALTHDELVRAVSLLTYGDAQGRAREILTTIAEASPEDIIAEGGVR